jgi:hypothetical protein
MPGWLAFFRRLPLLLLLTGGSLAIGLLVPSFYEWTSPLYSSSGHVELERGAAVVLLATIIGCALVMRLRAGEASRTAETGGRRLQFGLRGVFAAMTLTAVVFAIIRLLRAPYSVGAVAAVAMAIAGWSLICGGEIRWRMAAMLACMFLPFVWMSAFNVPFGRTSGLALSLPIGPGIVPAELIRAFAGLSTDAAAKIPAVIVIFQLLIGACLAHRGGKLALIYTLVLLAVSTLSSLLLHALYRA